MMQGFFSGIEVLCVFVVVSGCCFFVVVSGCVVLGVSWLISLFIVRVQVTYWLEKR